MLYCPKCQQTYDDGTQRFCTNEGARLLPLPTTKNPDRPKGIFTSILNKTNPQVLTPKDSGDLPEDAPKEPSKTEVSSFKPPSESKFFSPDQDDFALDMGAAPAESEEPESFEPIPLARIINPLEIPEKGSKHDELFPETANIKAGAESEPPASDYSDPETPEFELNLEGDSPAPSDPSPEIDLDLPDEFSEDSAPQTAAGIELNLDEPVSFSGDKSSDDILDLDEPAGMTARLAEDDLLELDPLRGDLPIIPAGAPSQLELELDEDPVGLADPGSSGIELDLDDSGGAPVPVPLDGEDLSLEMGDDGAISEPVEAIPVKQREGKKGREVVLEPIKKPTPVTASVDEIVIGATEETLPEPPPAATPPEGDSNWWLLPFLGVLVLGIGFGLWYLLGNSSAPVVSNTGVENVNQNSQQQNVVNSIVPEESITPAGNLPTGGEFTEPVPLDAPPPPRRVNQPPNTVRFKNESKNQKGPLAKQFLGFSIYYPKDWKQNKSNTKFLDISKKAPNGGLIEQILIEPYESLGTFSADSEIFEELVRKSNLDLKKILPNFQVISQGETNIQTGRWRAYEVKFQGGGTTGGGGKKLIVWGRRLWIPVQREGMKSGFIITMLATSLSNQVKSVDDVGEVGELATILKTFEPDLN